MGNAKIIPEQNKLFLPFQEAWIRDRSRIKLIEKSRQIGLSWSTAYDIVREHAKDTARLDAWVSSRDDIQARLFLEDCKKFSEILHTAAEDLGAEILWTDDKKNAITSYVLRFANGLRIHSMSSNPDAQAGKRGTRLLDEFALHKESRNLYSIAYHGVTWGGQIAIVSTHRWSHNYFNELVVEAREKGNPKKISLHRVTLQDALEQGFLYKLQSKLPVDDERQEMDEADYFNFIRNGCADEESFLQECMCVPADDNSAFLSYDQIAACEYEQNPANLSDWSDLSDLADCKSLYAGVDVGRKNDLTVIWLNELAGDRHLTRRVIVLKNEKFSRQEEILYSVLALPGLRRCCIDATGIGMQLAERAGDQFGKYRVEGVNFSAPVKEELAYPLKAAFEDLNLRIPFDKFVRADLRAIKKEMTAAGNIRFSADRSENGHSDRFWALALALHAKGRNDGPCRMEASRSVTPEQAIRDSFNDPNRMRQRQYEISEENAWPV